MTAKQCPKCGGESVYRDQVNWNCAECFHEWDESALEEGSDSNADLVKDANGTILHDGDSVSLIKELKIKGSSSAIKIGTKVKNIRLGDFGNGHNISCKIDGFGSMILKSEFVKKAG